MVNPSQKTEELSHLVSFLNASAIRGTPTPLPDGAGPDFLVATDKGEIGIEVTKLHREASISGVGRRQMEGIRDRVLAAAKRSWDGAGLNPLEVHVHFNHHETPFKPEISRIADGLVAIVQARMPTVGEHVHLSWNDGEALGLPKGIHAISIIRLPTHRRSYWLGADSDYEATLSAEQVQRTISSKNKKAGLYRSAARVVWLLLVLDSRRLSGCFDLEGAAFRAVYESCFARTFVFDRFSATVRELATRFPDSWSAA